MPVRKLKPIEERDPYAALVLDKFRELPDRCPDCNGPTEAREDERGRWRCGCWKSGCEGNRTWPNATKQAATDEWNRLCQQRANTD